MKRPASGDLIADSGTSKPSNDSSAAPRVPALLITTTDSARRALTWLAARAVDRSLSPGSLAGISLLLAVCAAAWFSGGGRGHGARGLLAMTGWLLFLMAARGLAAFRDRGLARRSEPASSASWPTDGGTDWLVLPTAAWADRTPAGSGAENAGPAESGALTFGWLATVCAVAAECAIYGGMAADIEQPAPLGAWPLAVLAVSAVAITDMLRACRLAALTPKRRREFGRNPIMRAAGALLRIPPALRGLIAFAGYAVNGPRTALLAVLGIEAIAIAAAIATVAKISSSATSAAKGAAPKRSQPPAPSPGTSEPKPASTGATITAVVGVAGSPGETTAVRYTTTPTPAWTAAGRVAARQAAGQTGNRAGAAEAETPDEVAAGPTGGTMILALRDDGAAARWAGRLVRGNLIPLPPALAGLIATAMLAALGLRHLPSFIALTQPVVMMLAAPGSSHPHDSRFDWLVPVMRAAAQFAYLGPLGFSLALPGPIVFSLCAIMAVWYASNTAIVSGSAAAGSPVSYRPRQDEDPGPGSMAAEGPVSWVGWGAGLGWETRMFVIGFAATFGLATFGYLGLAAYLGVLVCREAMSGYLVPRELTDVPA
jgi:hypothetical protein